MKKKIAAAIAVLVIGIFAALFFKLYPRTDILALPDELISVSSEQGQRMLLDADARSDFDELSENFEPQWLKSYCGVATSVAVLKSLGKSVTQQDFFSSETSDVRSRWTVTFTGMTLDALGGLLEAHGASVTVRYADSVGLDEFRESMVRNLSTDDDYIVVNYQREVLGQRKVGHISPLSAYDQETDMVLIMDTAAYNYPQTWVPVTKLYSAMNTLDSESKKSRGFVEISMSR
jgi:hypothetical protein